MKKIKTNQNCVPEIVIQIMQVGSMYETLIIMPKKAVLVHGSLLVAGLGFGRPKLGFGRTVSKTRFKPSFTVQNCPKLSKTALNCPKQVNSMMNIYSS